VAGRPAKRRAAEREREREREKEREKRERNEGGRKGEGGVCHSPWEGGEGDPSNPLGRDGGSAYKLRPTTFRFC
jgi:hypothetical protein